MTTDGRAVRERYRTMKAGRCKQCAITWQWIGQPLVRDSHCPRCGFKLRQTVHFARNAEWRELPKGTKALTFAGASAIFHTRTRKRERANPLDPDGSDITSPALRKDLDKLGTELGEMLNRDLK